jgi:ABC-2 type transport system ATP-binding protein
MSLLELHGVTKRFGALEAVHDVDLTVERGRVFGLLGPNGAGKTTLIRLVTGILGPDAGTIAFGGEPIRGRMARRIGYMPEERGLYRKMGVAEQLVYLGRLKGLSRADARQRAARWLERLGLAEWAGRRVEDLSKGMQQKVQFAATLLHDPELVILDEPFSGLDPVNLRGLLDEVQALRDDGRTVVLSTHRMDQVQAFCRDLALLHRGRIVLRGEVAAVRAAHARREYAVGFRGDTGSLTHPGFEVLEQEDERLRVRLREGFTGNDLLALLLERGVELTAFEEILPSIGDIFIERVSDPAPSAERPPAHA